VAAVAAVMLATVGAAHRAAAQRPVDFRVVSVGTVTARRYVGGGAGASIALGARLRLGALATLGHSAGGLATRNELMVTFHLTPYRRRGPAAYAGAGAALLADAGGTAEYMVLVLGLEAHPGRAAGWFLEGGVGGGVRLAAGYRWRL